MAGGLPAIWSFTGTTRSRLKTLVLSGLIGCRMPLTPPYCTAYDTDTGAAVSGGVVAEVAPAQVAVKQADPVAVPAGHGQR